MGVGVRVRVDLTFNPRRAMVMTYTHAKSQVKRQSVQKIECKRMDGRMDRRMHGGNCITSCANMVCSSCTCFLASGVLTW